MKKLLALIALLGGSVLCLAQVQLGRNVQIGGTSSGTTFEQQVVPPIGGQYVVVYPTIGTITSDPRGDSVIGPQGGHFNWSCVNGIGLCTIAPHMTANWSGFSLPSYVDPANVSAVYADAVTSGTPLFGQMPTGGANVSQLTCSTLSTTSSLFPAYGDQPPWGGSEKSLVTTLTGSTVATASCTLALGASTFFGASGISVDVPAIRLLVYYSGPPPPTRTAYDVVSPLAFNIATMTLSDDALGVTSINNSFGAFTFTGSGVSCTGTTCTFSSGTGAVPFSSLTSATNTAAAMLVGSGASLAPTGTGTITPSAVNLAASGNGGVTGLLPVANGGTGTASPGIVAGTNVTVSGTWPNQTVNSSGGGGGGTPGGSTTQIQYNNAGAFGGDPGFTTDGAGNVALKSASVADTTGNAGFIALKQGTAHATATSSIGLTAPASVTAYNIKLPAAQGTGALTNDGSGNLSWTTGSGVTSVAQTVPSWLTVSGSPVTTTGILAITAATGQTSHQVLGTCGTATSFAPCALVAGDIPASLTSTTSVNGTSIPSSVTLGQTVASGTAALGTSAIASGACATAVTATATGAATTDVIGWGFNADPTAITGYIPATSGMLTIISYPTANTVNFKVCNNTSASVTPGAVTLNWRVAR